MIEHKLIIGKRQTGKTERLIKESAEKQIPIICATQNMAKYAENRAKELGLDIPKPVAAEYAAIDAELRKYNSVLVDDAAIVLSQLLGKHIEAMAINTGHGKEEPIEVIHTEDEDKEEM